MNVDVKEAHRQVPTHRDDWARQACQVRAGGKVYLNKVGTFGVSSSPYYWSRAGVAMLRLVLDILGTALPSWQLLFSDDWLTIGSGRHCDVVFVLVLLMLSVLGVPLSLGIK